MVRQKSSRRVKEPTLPDSELEVMRILWKKQRASAREVHSQLKSEGSKWSYATVNTLLQRLDAKGLATSDKSQMTYIYSPKITRQQVLKKRAKQLVDKLYDGKGGPLVLQLLKSQRLSKNEVSQIRNFLGSLSSKDGG